MPRTHTHIQRISSDYCSFPFTDERRLSKFTSLDVILLENSSYQNLRPTSDRVNDSRIPFPIVIWKFWVVLECDGTPLLLRLEDMDQNTPSVLRNQGKDGVEKGTRVSYLLPTRKFPISVHGLISTTVKHWRSLFSVERFYNNRYNHFINFT